MGIRILSIVNSDSLRSSLSKGLREVVPNAELTWSKDLVSAKEIIKDNPPFRFVLVQSGFSTSQLISLVEISKAKASVDRARLVLLVSSENSSEENLSTHLSLGFSSMLIEPFSFDAIKESLKLSDTIFMAGSVARLTVAAGLQIKAHLINQNKMKAGGDLLKSVKTACEIFETDNPGKTVQSVAQDMSLLSVEERVKMNISSMYQGVSDRVRKLVLAKKLNSDLD